MSVWKRQRLRLRTRADGQIYFDTVTKSDYSRLPAEPLRPLVQGLRRHYPLSTLAEQFGVNVRSLRRFVNGYTDTVHINFADAVCQRCHVTLTEVYGE